jgi:hypothetical protein
LLLFSLARADIARELPRGARFVDYHLEVHGLPAGRVLVVVPLMPDDVALSTEPWVPCVREFSEDGTKLLAATDDRVCDLSSTTTVEVMRADDYQAWRARADAAFRAHDDMGIGIKKVPPHLPPPAPVVSCNTRLELRTIGPDPGPSSTTDVLHVTALTDDTCTVQVTPRPDPPTPTPPSVSQGPCSTGVAGTSAVSLGLGVGLVLFTRRRDDGERKA